MMSDVVEPPAARREPSTAAPVGLAGAVDSLLQKLLAVNRLAVSLGVTGSIRALWRHYVAPRGREYTLRRDGYEGFHLRSRSPDLWAFHAIICDDFYEPPYPAAPDVIVDAGAHIGLASVWYARRFPTAIIVALEPDPENFRLLRLNTIDYPNITVRQVALWTSSGALELRDSGCGSDAHRVRAVTTGMVGEGVTLVRGVDLETLLRSERLEHIDILKLNIEGAELELFDGATPWLDSVSCIEVELHEWIAPGCTHAFHRATQSFAHSQVRDWLTTVWR